MSEADEYITYLEEKCGEDEGFYVVGEHGGRGYEFIDEYDVALNGE